MKTKMRLPDIKALQQVFSEYLKPWGLHIPTNGFYAYTIKKPRFFVKVRDKSVLVIYPQKETIVKIASFNSMHVLWTDRRHITVDMTDPNSFDEIGKFVDEVLEAYNRLECHDDKRR